MAVGDDYVNTFELLRKKCAFCTRAISQARTSGLLLDAKPDDHALVGSEQGKILLFRQGQYSMTILSPPGDHGLPVTALTAVPGGFVAVVQKGVAFMCTMTPVPTRLYMTTSLN